MQQEIKVKKGQTIFDIALYCYNDANLVYNLLAENLFITDILMDLTGYTLLYTPQELVKYEAKENTKKLTKVVTIQQKQSIFDLSLQFYGNIENVYDLIQNNAFIDSIISDEISGNVLNINTEKNFVTEYYRKGLINVGTGTKAINYVWDGVYDIWDGTDDLIY